MPFYKCYGCMKTFHSESRVTACKYCHKILSESVNRAPNPPLLKRSQSAPVLGALTSEQEVRRVEVVRRQPRLTPKCPTGYCVGGTVSYLCNDDSGKSRKGKLYACSGCNALFIWDPEIQFDPRFVSMYVGDRMQPLNRMGFRCLGLETGLIAVKNIFKIGFKLKSEEDVGYRSTVGNPIVTSFEGGIDSFPRSGDILPDTAHCFAGTLPGCTTFPNDVSKTETYLFVCFLRWGFNTNLQQRRDVDSILRHYPGLVGERDKIEWPLHALEIAVDSVEPEDIWACVRCTKHWATDNWADGGKYVLDLQHVMIRKGLPSKIEQRIIELLKMHGAGTIPPTSL